jgi:hypothetical protein
MKPAPKEAADDTTMRIREIFARLSPKSKAEVLRYMRFIKADAARNNPPAGKATSRRREK